MQSADVDAELEQLTVNAGCTPLNSHGTSCGSDRESREKRGKDGLGLNNGQRRAPAAPHPGQPDPHEAVHRSQPGTSSRGTLKHADLVAQSQVLQLKGRA